MTKDILQTKIDYEEYLNEFKTWSKRKKKKRKKDLNALALEYDTAYQKGYSEWVNQTLAKGKCNGSITFKEINDVLNYGNKQSNIILTL